MQTKQTFSPKWLVCSILALLGIAAWAFLPGYRFSGIFLLALAALFPVYHLLASMKNTHPCPWKGVHTALTLLLCVFFAAIAVTLGFLVRSARGTDAPDSPYAVVLGAGVNGRVPSRSLRERLDAAFDYLTAHPDSIAVVSGGQGEHEEISEAQCMYDDLTGRGIAPDRIWMEDQATNTAENLRFSAELIRKRTGETPDRIAIVSSEYHLHRAKFFAGREGLQADLVPAATEVVPLRWNYYLREVFAMWYYLFLGGTK